MNPCLSWDLTDAKSTSFPCIDSYETLKDDEQNGEQVQNYAQNFMLNKEVEKIVKPKRCISNPSSNARVYYKREQPTNSTSSQADEIKYRQKGFLSEHSLPNEPKLSRSTEKLKEFLLTHSDFLDSIYEQHKNSKDEQQPSERKTLPAELWWVSPLKIPTSRSVPSVAMSNTYSAASSTSTHPRTRRSVEDLRQRVDSVCELVEAMGIIETEQQQTSRSVGVPLLQIPSTAASQTSSRGGSEELKPHTSYKTVASQCTVIDPQQLTTEHNNIDNTNNNTGSPTLRMTSGTSSPAPQYITSTPSPASNAVRVASRQDTCSRYDQPQSSISVSDLACIHIVNPMLSKLARLCTAQGQQYLNVLEELEKACNDFHNACKFQGVTK